MLLEEELIKLRFYHGTSSERYRKMQRNGGYLKGPHSYSNWLAPEGFYLFCNRPLLAYKYATKHADNDRAYYNDPTIKPLVFEIKLKKDYVNSLIDLSTDDGISRLDSVHKKLYTEIYALGRLDGTPRTYRNSVKKTFGHLFTNSFNFDSKALEILTDLNAIPNVKMIIAAIQEGPTFNFRVHNHKLKYDRVEGFSGIRLRDHLEACIVNTKIIRSMSQIDTALFEDKYRGIIHATLTDTHDSK